MVSVKEVLKKLKSKARPDQLEGMARFGLTPDMRWGISVPDMRRIAKETGKNHYLALELWKTRIQEARMVAGMIGDPEQLTNEQMEEWVKDFNSWDVCDQVCMNLFDKSPLAWKKVFDWSQREEEFVKRAAFSLIACLAWHDKSTKDEEFLKFLPLLIKGSSDERNFVKKSVNWALRGIGKRNRSLNKEAIKIAKEIQKMESRSARWIATDALRELTSSAVKKKLGI
jgi:3-methyladenine DNA glycosylase AlkD